MSHFSVLVIGENVEEQLAPYHEFECTGTDDQYVKDIDITEKVRKQYQEGMRRRFLDPQGVHHCPYQDRFKAVKKNLGDPFECRSYVCPEGWQEIEKPTSECSTFAQYVEDDGNKLLKPGELPDITGEHKYGFATVDENGEITLIIDRTNPNAKWDYWRVGGRWAGHLRTKQPATVRPEYGWEWTFNADTRPVDARLADDNRASECLKSDVDWEGMRSEAGEKAARSYDFARSILDGLPESKAWEDVESENIDKRREIYHAQPRVKALREAAMAEGSLLDWDDTPEDFAISRDQYIQNARNRACTTYAIVKDGKWFQKGEMGWFGISSGEKDQETWNAIWNKIVDELPEDTKLTIVDCHI